MTHENPFRNHRACAGALVLSQAHWRKLDRLRTSSDQETTGSGMVAATKKDTLAPTQEQNFNTSGSKIKNPTK
jgi:hypothetical protein